MLNFFTHSALNTLKTNMQLGSRLLQGVSHCELTRGVKGNCGMRIWQFLHPSDSSTITAEHPLTCCITRLPFFLLMPLFLSRPLGFTFSQQKRLHIQRLQHQANEVSIIKYGSVFSESNFLSSFFEQQGTMGVLWTLHPVWVFRWESNKYKIFDVFGRCWTLPECTYQLHKGL